MGNYNAGFNLGNIAVTKVCNSSTCRRAVCIPSAWTFGDFGAQYDTIVDVDCYRTTGSAPALSTSLQDTDFRVFVGAEALNSQYAASEPYVRVGWQYEWVNWNNYYTSSGCYPWGDPVVFQGRLQHQTPYPQQTIQFDVCKTGVGAYHANL